MKNNNLFSIFSTLLLLCAGFTAAWPWPAFFGGESNGLILARQQQSASASPSQTGSASPSATGSASNSASNSGSASNTASITSTGSGSASATGTISRSGSGSISGSVIISGNRNVTKTTAVDPRLPPGGISMMTPAAIDGMTFVKVGNQVTFKWNYTSLSFPPSYIDVIATNTINSQAYTIAANQSWQSTQAVTWDTGDYASTASIPFVVATYTLMVYDANSAPTAQASAGYLSPFSQLLFGIYTPQPYTPLNNFRCATCSGAMSMHEKQALSVLLGTCVITVLSFTWFAAGFGAFA